MTEWDKAIRKTPWIYVGEEALKKLDEILKAQEEKEKKRKAQRQSKAVER